MSGTFRTEADVMHTTAARVDDTNNEVQGELTRLRGVVDGVQASWDGNAHVSFDHLMVRWTESAAKLQEALQSIAENIRANARNFENAEVQNAQAFEAIAGQGLNL